MKKLNISAIGIFGGSFDPPHKGHLKISQVSLKKIKLKKLYWIVTNKNPFKKKPLFNLHSRIAACKKITNKNKKIKVIFLENKVKSRRTIDIVKFLFKKNKKVVFYLIIGSDVFCSLHKWKSWKKILKLCKLVVFSRKGFDKKMKKSVINKHLNQKEIIYIKNHKVNISSSQLRVSYLK